MTLGQRIAAARKAAGMTQAALAEKCGWESASRVGNYEQGTREPSLEDLRAIARAVAPHATYASLVLDAESVTASQIARLDVDTVREVADMVREGLRDAYQDPRLQLDLTDPVHAARFVDGYSTALEMEQQKHQSKAALVLAIRRQVHAQGAREDGSGDQASNTGTDRSSNAGKSRRKATSGRRAAAKT